MALRKFRLSSYDILAGRSVGDLPVSTAPDKITTLLFKAEFRHAKFLALSYANNTGGEFPLKRATTK